MGKPLRVLIVEDSELDAELVVRELRRQGFEPQYERVDTEEAMAAALDRQEWDVVTSDYSMPRFGVPAVLMLIRKRSLDLPVVVVSGSIGEEAAVASMKAGVHDYVMKHNLARLGAAIEREVKDAAVRKEKRQAEDTIHHLAYYDGITGLPNRVLFLKRLAEAVNDSRQERHTSALLLIDLDRFREINNTLGHAIGDELLRQVAHRLRDALWKSDTVARLGGNEFGVLVARVEGPEPGSNVARRILQAMEPTFVLGGVALEVEASIGIAVCPADGDRPEILLQRADMAMDQAKRGKTGYAAFSAEMDRFSPQKLSLATDLRQAINGDQLYLSYQPEVSLKEHMTKGAEALVRWKHPHHGLMSPSSFIDLAEKTGMIRSLTLRVLAMALRQVKSWRSEGAPLYVAVNVSSRSLQDPRFPQHVEELLKDNDLPATALQVEITESTIMDDPMRALAVSQELSDMGVSLTIDDFGTGYSSLSYLKRLPVSSLKVDQSFVMDMIQDRDDAEIVRSTIHMAHSLDLSVVAEGVETQAVMDRLGEYGCDTAQGYLMSPPLQSGDFGAWLRKSPWGLKTA